MYCRHGSQIAPVPPGSTGRTGHGRRADHANGEKTYLVLSLVAKSVLARQIFAGSLAA